MIHILLGGFLLLVHLKTLSLVVSVGMASFWQLMHGFYWTAVGLSTQLPACSQETTYCAKKLHFRAKKKTPTETAWKWHPSWSTLMNWAQMSQMSSDVHGFGRGNIWNPSVDVDDTCRDHRTCPWKRNCLWKAICAGNTETPNGWNYTWCILKSW